MPRSRFVATLLAVFSICIVAVTCQESARAAEETLYRLETYGVGQGVYVRALAIDRKRGSLWVGTSVGALEIDLATADMRNNFTREHGLANEYIFAIGLDPRGHVWFGTNAGGASTYLDGAWKTYFPMHGLADYWVYAFAFDRQGGAWIGTWNGVNYLDTTSEKMTTYRTELINIWVYGIDIDDQGRVWFGTEGGVSMFDGKAWKSWTHDDGLGAPNIANKPQSTNTGLGTKSRHDLNVNVGSQESYNPDYVFATLYDRTGKGVWFGTWGGGVSLFDGKEGWTSYSEADGLAGNVVYSIAQDATDALWFGTNKGVSRFDGETWTTIRHGLPAPHVYSIATADDGTVWAGTKGGVTKLWSE
jgi:ligand-binding sensor domain-containing protein